MGFAAPAVVLFAWLPLSGPVAPEPETAEPPPPLVQPFAGETIDSGFAGGTPEVLGALAEARRRGRKKVTRKQAERPEEFWWTSSEDVLRGIYGGAAPRACCKFCGHGQPCGNTCISRFYTCRTPPGCACQRPIGYGG